MIYFLQLSLAYKFSAFLLDFSSPSTLGTLLPIPAYEPALAIRQ
jgi:hypothetical protein